MSKNYWLKVLSVFIIVSAICVGVIAGAIYSKNKRQAAVEDSLVGSGDNIISGDIISGEKEESGEKEDIYLGPNIYSGDSRPIAVMIDNERPARQNHGGLNSAYMLYEFIIEGGETRIMAFFKNATASYIGPVRSARHYFLDYAMEHDAIFVHFGWSPKAQSDIKTLSINNINGIFDTFYWRVAPKGSYHNAITSMENIQKMIERKKYRTTTEKGSIVTYNKEDEDIASGDVANYIMIKYSARSNSSYRYDAERKVYLRDMRGEPHIDSQTKEQFYAKNVVMIYVKDELLDDPEDKGRRELYNIGTGDGYFATNGRAIKIKWEKQTRDGRTIYRDLDGNEITFNDGITWVQIVPKTGSITISE